MAENKGRRLPLLKFDFMVLWSNILHLLLMFTNYYTIRDLFIHLNINVDDTVVYAMTAVLILNVLPAFMGLSVARGEWKRKKVQIILATVVTILMAVLVGGVRLLWVREQIYSGMMGGRNTEEIYGHVFLMALPLLTAMAAFAIPGLFRRIPSEQPEDPEKAAEGERNDG